MRLPEQCGMGGLAGEHDQLLLFCELRQDGGRPLLALRIQVNQRIIQEQKANASPEKELRHGQAHGQGEQILRACGQQIVGQSLTVPANHPRGESPIGRNVSVPVITQGS